MKRIGLLMTAALVLLAPALMLFPDDGTARAQEKAFVLHAGPEIIENGLVKFLKPRFSLKTGVRITVAPLDLSAPSLTGADAYLLATGAIPEVANSTRRAGVFTEIDGSEYTMIVVAGPGQAHAERFMDWLTSKVGTATLAGFKLGGEVTYGPVEAKVVEEVAAAPLGDVKLGAEIALRRCGRCHVVSEKNKFGGIGSTPSFGAMKNLPRWRQRFEAFWTLNPHPSFTQIEGVTEPFDPARPPHIAPLVMTMDEVDALMAYILSIKKKDLGAPLTTQ